MIGNVRVEGLVNYTRSQLECHAAELLRTRSDVVFRIPVNVERLLEGIPNVDLRPMSGLLNKFSVEGAVCNQLLSKKITVFVDQNIFNGHDDARFAAVIGEELAHITLHPALIMQVKGVEDFLELRQCPQWRQIESDARLFSAAVRMPEFAIRRRAEGAYLRVIDEFGFSDPHAAALHVRNLLAEQFVVPVEDMQSRLIQWPCEIMASVIASVQGRHDSLQLSAPATPPSYVQRKLLMDE